MDVEGSQFPSSFPVHRILVAAVQFIHIVSGSILVSEKIKINFNFQLMKVYDVGWQVPALSLLFGMLGCGNIITTSMTIPLKLRDSKTGQLKYRFTRLDKYFWSHRRRRNSVSQVNDLEILVFHFEKFTSPLLKLFFFVEIIVKV